MALLEGRVVVVTGAGRGMGREHAHFLAGHGALVVVNDLGCDRDGSGADPSVAEAVAKDIRAAGGQAVASGHDAADLEGAQGIIDLAITEFGAVHALVNNAGVLRDRMFVNMTEDDWDVCIRGHLRAVFAPSRIVAAHWRDRSKAGDAVAASIVNTSSTSGLIGQVGQSNYGAAKAGIASLTGILAQELWRYGVRVNALTPVARTRMTEETPGVADLVKAPASPEAFDVYHPANVSPLVAWLVTENCPLNGEVFYVRGQEIRRYAPWQYAETWTTDGEWTVDEIASLLEPVATPS